MMLQSARPAADEAISYYFNYINLVPDGDILQILKAQHPATHQLVAAMSEEQAGSSPAPGEWSVKQILQHLVDTERLFCFRALWFARGEQAPLPGMEPEPWMANTDANARSVSDLLSEFAHVRAATLSFFGNLDESAWQRRGTASGGTMGVRALAWIAAGHELHHCRSIREHHGL